MAMSIRSKGCAVPAESVGRIRRACLYGAGEIEDCRRVKWSTLRLSSKDDSVRIFGPVNRSEGRVQAFHTHPHREWDLVLIPYTRSARKGSRRCNSASALVIRNCCLSRPTEPGHYSNGSDSAARDAPIALYKGVVAPYNVLFRSPEG